MPCWLVLFVVLGVYGRVSVGFVIGLYLFLDFVICWALVLWWSLLFWVALGFRLGFYTIDFGWSFVWVWLVDCSIGVGSVYFGYNGFGLYLLNCVVWFVFSIGDVCCVWVAVMCWYFCFVYLRALSMCACRG